MDSVSIFNSAKSTIPFTCADIDKVFAAIKNGKFWGVVKQYRETKNKDFKKTIPCYTPSGVFSHRAIDGLTEYTNILSLDIDKQDNQHIDLQPIIESLRENDYILAFHKSLGGEGYAVYIRTDVEPEYHTQAFESVEKEFLSKYGIVLDKACKDISRLRFVSADSRLYYNKNAKTLKITVAKPQVRQLPNGESGDDLYLVQLLNRIIDSGIDITDTYSDWVVIAFGIANALNEEGRPYFHQISEASNKYNFRIADKLYNDALRREADGRGRVTTRRSIFEIAKRYGIYNKQ